MKDCVTVPICKLINPPGGYTVAGCDPICQIKYIGTRPPYLTRSFLSLENKEKITLQPLQSYKLYFNVMVMTSLPATSIVYGSDHNYCRGLSIIITQIPTNDTYLNITLVNKTLRVLHFEPDTLSFYCKTVLK